MRSQKVNGNSSSMVRTKRLNAREAFIDHKASKWIKTRTTKKIPANSRGGGRVRSIGTLLTGAFRRFFSSCFLSLAQETIKHIQRIVRDRVINVAARHLAQQHQTRFWKARIPFSQSDKMRIRRLSRVISYFGWAYENVRVSSMRRDV